LVANQHGHPRTALAENALCAAGSIEYQVFPLTEKQDAMDDFISGASQREQRDIRCRRLLFRSWHCGTQESDFILGSFAEKSLDELNSDQLDKFEALLDCADPDLFEWIIQGSAPPPEHDHDVLRLLRGFCATQRHRHQQKESASI